MGNISSSNNSNSNNKDKQKKNNKNKMQIIEIDNDNDNDNDTITTTDTDDDSSLHPNKLLDVFDEDDFKDFTEAQMFNENFQDKGTTNHISIHLQKRNARQCQTLIVGIAEDLDEKRMLKVWKKSFKC